MVSTNFLFPEVYVNGEQPLLCDVVDEERYSLRTPAYGFGWVISRLELYQSLTMTDKIPWPMVLNKVPYMVDKRFHIRWKEKGLKDNIYGPRVPEAEHISDDFVLIILACNSDADVMDSIMANKAYHDECRACMNSPKTMELEPAWFRVGLTRMPKGFVPDDEPIQNKILIDQKTTFVARNFVE